MLWACILGGLLDALRGGWLGEHNGKKTWLGKTRQTPKRILYAAASVLWAWYWAGQPDTWLAGGMYFAAFCWWWLSFSTPGWGAYWDLGTGPLNDNEKIIGPVLNCVFGKMESGWPRWRRIMRDTTGGALRGLWITVPLSLVFGAWFAPVGLIMPLAWAVDKAIVPAGGVPWWVPSAQETMRGTVLWLALALL